MKISGGILAAVILALAMGCTTVEPWERGRLAHDCMQIPPDPEESAFRGKAEAAREGSSGGTRNAGGGCGCN